MKHEDSPIFQDFSAKIITAINKRITINDVMIVCSLLDPLYSQLPEILNELQNKKCDSETMIAVSKLDLKY